ncbi:MAG: protein kinase [Candidatus Omnitrophota bacterium]
MITPYNIADKIASRYEVLKIMWGGMGYVLVCKDLKLGIIVALKTFNPETFDIESFRKEARNWIAVGESLNIVEAFDVFVVDSAPFIVMEYISGLDMGSNLRQWLIASQQLDLKQILQFAYQTCNGIEYAWSKINLVHQDIKPENLLITSDEIIKVSDFGLSKSVFGRIAQGGTYHYMSPEHFYGNTDTRSDIYSTGITMYEMMEGRRPFPGLGPEDFRRQHESWELQFFRSAPTEALRKLQNIVRKATEKSPQSRYQNFSELMQDLDCLFREQYGRSLKGKYRTRINSSLRLSDRGFALCKLGFEREGMDLLQEAVAKDLVNIPALDALRNYIYSLEGESKKFWKRIWQQLIKDLKIPWKALLFILLIGGLFLACRASTEFPVVSISYFCFMLFLLMEAYINFYSKLSLDRFTISGIGLGLIINLILSFVYRGNPAFDAPLVSLGKSALGIASGFLIGVGSRKISFLFLKKEGLGLGSVKEMMAIGALVGAVGLLYVEFLWPFCTLIWFLASFFIYQFRRIILEAKKIFVGDCAKDAFSEIPTSVGFLTALIFYILFKEQIQGQVSAFFASPDKTNLTWIGMKKFMQAIVYRYF